MSMLNFNHELMKRACPSTYGLNDAMNNRRLGESISDSMGRNNRELFPFHPAKYTIDLPHVDEREEEEKKRKWYWGARD